MNTTGTEPLPFDNLFDLSKYPTMEFKSKRTRYCLVPEDAFKQALPATQNLGDSGVPRITRDKEADDER